MSIAARLCAVSVALMGLSGHAACPQEGSGAVSELHRAWILEGWERRDGDPAFVFEKKLGRFYDMEGQGVVIHDSYDPDKRVARSAREYGSFFESTFNDFRSARHAVTDGPHVIVGRDLATSSLEFIARLEAKDGRVNAARAQSQTVWRCTHRGWRIVREQNAVVDMPVPKADAILATKAATKATLLIEPGARTTPTAAAAAVTKAFDSWARGEGNLFQDLLADDTVWTIEGSGRFARTYPSRGQFLREAVEPFGSRLSVPVRPTVRRVFADGATVAVVWDGKGVAADGEPYSNSYVWIFDMEGRKAKRVTAFLDLPAYEAVLARVNPDSKAR